MHTTILVLGAGLSGLLTAKRLKQNGYDVTILESRDRVGGRIYTANAALNTPVEMGATWFGEKHVHLLKLLKELGIGYYEQHSAGQAYFEPFSLAPPQRIEIPPQLPSYRIQGGSKAVIDALVAELESTQIVLGTKVEALNFVDNKVEVNAKSKVWKADAVVSTIPPGLLLRSVDLQPQIDNALYEVGMDTHTWMQDSIKTALVFDVPFWREKNGSGTLFSNVGPMTECYDHSDYKVKKFALCGFVNSGYAAITKEERKAKVLAQLQKFYGKVIHTYADYVEYIWADDRNTKHQSMPDIFPHQNNGHPIYQSAYFENRLYISGAETAPHFPGYMDGAVESAEIVVQKCMAAYPLI